MATKRKVTALQTGFTGWYRQTARDPWQALVQAASDREAWDKLLDRPERGDRCVTATGIHPDQGKRRPSV